MSKFIVHVKLDVNVGLLRIFPSISLATIKAFLNPPIMGVVLQTFGSGNIPSNRADIIDELKAATDRGAIIVSLIGCVLQEDAYTAVLSKPKQCIALNVSLEELHEALSFF